MDKASKVEFYVLEAAGMAARLHFACRLAEKAYTKGHEVYAHTPSADVARQLDEMLWTFRQGSFIPHQIRGAEAARAPVRIGTGDTVQDSGELLINLCDTAPDFAAGFGRVAEIVGGEPAARAAGRDRFRDYRTRGIEPQTHQIG